jgi:putative transposase
MAFGQLAFRKSLRDLISSLNAQATQLYHLGLKQVQRSTLSDANNKRPAAIYEQFFHRLYEKILTLPRSHGFRFKNPLYAIDTTTVDLCLSVFPWAAFRKTKGAVKLHTQLNLAGQIPSFLCISNGKTHELSVVKQWSFEPGSIVVLDRGFNDFSLYANIHAARATFVTRQKKNAAYRVVERRAPVGPGILADQVIRFTGYYASQNYPHRLRRIRYRDAETKKVYVFLTNNFTLAASTIARIYKSRWQIELFFKWVKQHLKIKAFWGTSPNAVKTQIWIALCVYLMLFWMKHLSRSALSLLEITRRLQLNLLNRRELLRILNPKEQEPPKQLYMNQLTFDQLLTGH